MSDKDILRRIADRGLRHAQWDDLQQQTALWRNLIDEIALLPDHDAIAARLAEVERVLEREGFRRCDIPACNCQSWHHVGGYAARFREIDEATQDYYVNGESLLARVEKIMRERDIHVYKSAEYRVALTIARDELEKIRRDAAMRADSARGCNVVGCTNPLPHDHEIVGPHTDAL